LAVRRKAKNLSKTIIKYKMKFKKPTEKTGKDTLALAGGVIAGSMASRAVIGFIDKPEEQADATKAKNATLLKRSAIVLVSGVLAASVDGNDTVSTLVKGAFTGMATMQALEAIKTLAEDQGVTTATEATTTGKKAVANLLGLNGSCGCHGTLNGTRRRKRRGMNAPYDLPAYTASNMDTAPRPLALNGNSPMAPQQPLI
jgi:hypothetical protein